MNRLFFRLFAASILAAFSSSTNAAGKKIAPTNDAAAKALAALLAPLGLTPNGDAGGLAKVKAQTIKVLEAMETCEVKAGPGATDLLNNAYRFRPDVGPAQRAAAAGTLSNAWRDARAMGLFDDKHHFGGKITKGTDVGQNAVFEYIVPASIAKEFAQDLTNIRIAPPSRSRLTPSDVKPDDQAYVKTLESVSHEVAGMKKLAAIQDGGPRNILGQTPEQAKKLWQADMDAGGEKSLSMPNILLRGYMKASPTKENGETWRLQAKVTNLSQHATEIEVQCYAIGATACKHENFLMLDSKQKIQLRRGQEETLDFSTLSAAVYQERSDKYDPPPKPPKGSKGAPQKSKVTYRGAMFRVIHSTGEAAKVSTEDSLIHLIDDTGAKSVSTLPNFFADAKEVKKK